MRKSKLNELKELIEEFKSIKQIKINTQSKFISTEVYDNYLNNGCIIRREKILKGKNDGSAVVVLALNNNNEVILTVEPRVFSKRTVGIGLPAGYIEKGETPLYAAKRELKEETGCIGNEVIDLGGFYQDIGVSSAYNRLFLIKNCIETYETNPDPGEYIKYFKCTYDEALELIDKGYIEGCNAIITLNRAKKYIKGR